MGLRPPLAPWFGHWNPPLSDVLRLTNDEIMWRGDFILRTTQHCDCNTCDGDVTQYVTSQMRLVQIDNAKSHNSLTIVIPIEFMALFTQSFYCTMNIHGYWLHSCYCISGFIHFHKFLLSIFTIWQFPISYYSNQHQSKSLRLFFEENIFSSFDRILTCPKRRVFHELLLWIKFPNNFWLVDVEIWKFWNELY